MLPKAMTTNITNLLTGNRSKKMVTINEPDLLSVPGNKCPYISNDHPKVCTEEPHTSCLKCPEYLDGLCDLIPWDKENMTDNQEKLLALYQERNELYASMDPIYRRIWALADEIGVALGEVRREQGR